MSFEVRGVLRGHGGWITSIAVPDLRSASGNDTFSAGQMILSSSRDKTVIQWDLENRDEERHEYGRAYRALRGHSHFVEDVVVSRDGQFALTASWDRTIRLWDLNFSTCTKVFNGHKGDVLSVAFSPDNRQIVSGSRDRSIKLWNTIGECKCSINESTHNYPHSDWVSAVKYSPNTSRPLVVSSSWDKTIKVWSVGKAFTLDHTLSGHTGYINDIVISPDGSICASAGKDGTVMLWDINEGRHLFSVDAHDIVNSLCFSPSQFLLTAGTDSGVVIFDLREKETVTYLDKNSSYGFKVNGDINPAATAVKWAADGSVLFAGYSDSLIRCWSPAASSGF